MNWLTIMLREYSDQYNDFIQKTRHRMVKKITESALQNLDLIQAIAGAQSSAAFEKAYLWNVPTFKKRKDLFAHCLNIANTNPLYLEFGTYKGNSINILAKLRPQQPFYGFDSFEGLPENWTLGCKKGAFSMQGNLPAVRSNVTLIKGFFEVSLPPFIMAHKHEKIAFLHIDCDLYSSTKTVLENLYPLITNGTIICFDEYYNYPDWENGEYKAFLEFTTTHKIEFEYVGYIRMGSQMAIKIIERGRGSNA